MTIPRRPWSVHYVQRRKAQPAFAEIWDADGYVLPLRRMVVELAEFIVDRANCGRQECEAAAPQDAGGETSR